MRVIVQMCIHLPLLTTARRLPEIKWSLTKTHIKIDCAACGNNGEINTQHKLLTYILKTKAQKKKKDKSSKKERRDRRSAKGSAVRKGLPEPEEEVEWFTDTSKEAVEERKRKEFEKMTEGRKAVSTVGYKDSPTLVLRDFVKTKEPTMTQIIAELKRLQVARGFTESEKFKVLIESIIDASEPKTVPAQFEKYAPLLQKVVVSDQSANLLLLCVEELVGVVEKKLLPRTPLILQKLYDADILEEDAILKWADAPPESSIVTRDVAIEVRKAANPFVAWLKEADEEDDE